MDEKEKQKEYQKQYREINKEKLLEKKKKYYEIKKEDILQKRKEYYENNKEPIKEYKKEYQENNKEKIKEYMKEYRENNKEILQEKNKEYKKEYYEMNKEIISEKAKEYYQENKEQILEKQKEYEQNNKEQIKEKNKKYYQENKEIISEKSKEYYEENKEIISEKSKEYYEENKCEHDKRKKYCIICSPEIACQNCILECMSRTKIYRPYCFACYCVLNPDIEIKRRYKTKENLLAEALKAMNLGIEFIQDKRVYEGCSKRRPDFFFELFTHTVIVECDENGHRDYDTTCEIAKLNETFTDLADRPMVLIRFNPDKYEDKSCFDRDAKLIKNEWGRRIKVLKKEIKKALKEIPEDLITIKKLFFD